MSKLIRIGFNNVTAKLYGADDNAKLIVSSMLSYFVEGYQYTDAYKSRRWDGRSTFFQYGNCTFPRGFVDDVETGLIAKGYQVQRVCHPLPAALGPENPKVDNFPDDPRYDYQPETVRRLIARGQIIARVATGGGKSKIAKLATARINRTTLFLTTRKILMRQMAKGYAEGGVTVGVVGDGEWEPCFVNVGMVQTLAARLKPVDEYDRSAANMRLKRIRDQTIAFLESVELLIGEEAHEAGSNGYFEVMKYLKNAVYRLALTATPFMRDGQEANMRLKAAFGPVAIDITEKMLIERGILATPKFIFRRTAKPDTLRKTTPYLRAVELGIVGNAVRNADIVREAKEAAAFGLPVLILVQRKPHGKALSKLLHEAGLRNDYIFGEDDSDSRDNSLERLKSGQIDVLIGSTILDVGVDVPAIGLVILAGGGKAEVALRQRIGRGLRFKKPPLPNVAFILDYDDEHNAKLREHALERQAIIKNTPGFAENVLDRATFDYASFGFTRLS